MIESRQLPSKLIVTFTGPGHCREPGRSGFTDGPTRSRSTNFPAGHYHSLKSAIGEASAVPGMPADGPEVLADPVYSRRVAALVDTVASLVSSWATEFKD